MGWIRNIAGAAPSQVPQTLGVQIGTARLASPRLAEPELQQAGVQRRWKALPSGGQSYGGNPVLD